MFCLVWASRDVTTMMNMVGDCKKYVPEFTSELDEIHERLEDLKGKIEIHLSESERKATDIDLRNISFKGVF